MLPGSRETRRARSFFVRLSRREIVNSPPNTPLYSVNHGPHMHFALSRSRIGPAGPVMDSARGSRTASPAHPSIRRDSGAPFGPEDEEASSVGRSIAAAIGKLPRQTARLMRAESRIGARKGFLHMSHLRRASRRPPVTGDCALRIEVPTL